VSQAVQSLIQKHLLIVEDEAGTLLATPAIRRSIRSRLYFRLHIKSTNVLSESEITFSPKAVNAASLEPMTSETEFRNAKITKEKNTIPSLKETLIFMDEHNANPQSQHPSGEVYRLLRHYSELFQAHSPRRLSPPLTWQKEGVMMSHLLEQYSVETLLELINAFFHLDDKWVKEQGYSLTAFRYRLPQLLMRPSVGKPQEPLSRSRQKAEAIPSSHVTAETAQKAWHFDKDKQQFVAED